MFSFSVTRFLFRYNKMASSLATPPDASTTLLPPREPLQFPPALSPSLYIQPINLAAFMTLNACLISYTDTHIILRYSSPSSDSSFLLCIFQRAHTTSFSSPSLPVHIYYCTYVLLYFPFISMDAMGDRESNKYIQAKKQTNKQTNQPTNSPRSTFDKGLVPVRARLNSCRWASGYTNKTR